MLSYIGRKIEFDALRKYIEDLKPDECASFNDLIRFLASLALELTKDNFEV
jgi:hypothetical protein